MLERDVVLTGKQDGQTTIDLPVTRLGNVEDGADVKTAPESGDYIPIIDGSDRRQMKKVLWEQMQGTYAQGLDALLTEIRDKLDGKLAYCYDWDGSLLGACRLPLGADADTVDRVLRGFAAQLSSAVTDEYGYASDASKPLTNKPGYRFEGVWLWADSDAFCCYMDPNITYPDKYFRHELLADYTAEQRAENAQIAVKLQQGEQPIRLKAAYCAQATVNVGVGNAGMVQLVDFAYSRIGMATESTGLYTLSLTVRRENKHGSPVGRLREPIIVKTDTIGDKTAFGYIDLDNSDEERITIQVHRSVDSVRIYVVDAYGHSSPITAGSSSESCTIARNAGEQGTEGYVKFGTMGFVEKAMRTAVRTGNTTPLNSSVSALEFKDIGLMYQGAVITNPLKATPARKNLLLAYQEAETHGYAQALTFEQMQYGVDNGRLSTADGSALLYPDA